MYYSNKITHHPYRGKLDVYGGSAKAGGEPGASGTVYLKHTDNNYTILKVDNKGQFSSDDEIPHLSQRLDLAGGNLDRSLTYTAPNGVSVTTGCFLHPCRSCGSCQSYSLAHLFDQTHSTSSCHFFLSACGSAHLNFNLKRSHFINYIRIYPSCNFKTDFKVSKKSRFTCFSELFLYIHLYKETNSTSLKHI